MARQERVRACQCRIKGPSAAFYQRERKRTLSRVRSLERVAARRKKGRSMADVAYVALLIGVFALLALMLRGLEKLQ